MIQNVVNYQKLGCNFRHDLLSNVGLTFSSFLAKELNDREWFILYVQIVMVLIHFLICK